MANFNKVTLIGRLTRDVETRAFANGGMVANFGFAVTNRKKNSATGQWEDEPMFIDCSVFNRGEFGKLADLVRDRCRKGSQIFIEGSLHLDTWTDKTTGQNRSKHKVVVETVQLLDPRPPGEGGGSYTPRTNSGGGFSSPPVSDGPPDEDDGGGNAPTGGTNGDIPF